MQHTPGPWTVESDDGVDFTVLGGKSSQVRIAVECGERDARLICAAPSMLQALQSVLFTLEQEGDASVIAPAYKAHLAAAIRAAIRAAIGE